MVDVQIVLAVIKEEIARVQQCPSYLVEGSTVFRYWDTLCHLEATILYWLMYREAPAESDILKARRWLSR